MARQGGPWAQGEALNLEGLLALTRGEFSQAAELFARAAVRLLAAGEVARQVDALNNRAIALFELGSPKAEGVFAEALEAAGEVPLLRARVLLNLGVVRERQGRTDEAEALYREALHLAEEAGVLEAMGRAWNNLGALFHRQGRREEAEAAYLRALRALLPTSLSLMPSASTYKVGSEASIFLREKRGRGGAIIPRFPR